MVKETPKWLSRIQQNSWEPEILLSGFVLVGLTKVPGYLDEFFQFFHLEVTGNNFQGIFSGLKIASILLVIGLISHLFLRAVWIGFVGLSYTFPKGIQSHKLSFQPAYLHQIDKIPSFIKMIDRLEKVCSSLFAICFFILMVIFGLLVSIVALVFFFMSLSWATGGWLNQFIGNNLDPLILFLVVVVSIDFISLGLFRVNKWVAKIYFPIYKLIGWLTLAFLYRPIYYTFATNLPKNYLRLSLLLFFGISISLQIVITENPDNHPFSKLSVYSSENSKHLFSGYYEDRSEKWQSVRAFIPSPILKDRFLELVIKNHVRHDKFMKTNCAQFEENPMSCVSDFYKIYIDDTEINNVSWYSYFYQPKSQKTYLTVIDTDTLSVGKHFISIRLANQTDSADYCNILFFKQ